MRLFFLLVMGFLVSVNAIARELIAEEKVAIEATVRDGMKDPDAAKFYYGDFLESDKNSLYCGLVNGKNSYGAYTGKQLFSVMVMRNNAGEYKTISMDKDFSDDTPLSQGVIAASCAGAGYNVKVERYLVKNVNAVRKKKGLPPLTKSQISN